MFMIQLKAHTTYVAFQDIPEVALKKIESQSIKYNNATKNGTGIYRMVLSSQVCTLCGSEWSPPVCKKP